MSFTTRVQVRAGDARTKQVTLPLLDEPVVMGVHGDVAAHYRLAEGSYQPHPTTLDYLVGATVACLCGTFGGLLSGLGQPVGDGQLEAEGSGELADDGGTLRLRGVHVDYRLKLSDGVDADKVRRAHEHHRAKCPIARSIGQSVVLSTNLTLL